MAIVWSSARWLSMVILQDPRGEVGSASEEIGWIGYCPKG